MTDKKNLDWTCFTVKIPLNVDRNDIVNAWMNQEGLEKWFLRLAEFTGPDGSKRNRRDKILVGDRYKWIWHGWSDEVVEQGEVLEPESDEFMRFTFGKAGNVGVGLTDRDGETILQLRQENIPDDEESMMNFHVGCKTGWTFYLLNLKSILFGGPDLRNKNSKLQMD